MPVAHLQSLIMTIKIASRHIQMFPRGKIAPDREPMEELMFRSPSSWDVLQLSLQKKKMTYRSYREHVGESLTIQGIKVNPRGSNPRSIPEQNPWELHFQHPQNDNNNNSTYIMSLLWDLNEITFESHADNVQCIIKDLRNISSNFFFLWSSFSIKLN